MRPAAPALAALLLSALPLAAQDFPTKPVELIVPWAPGGATDLVARIVASEMEKTLGQAIVVVNKPGAGGMVGSEIAAKAEPDGYTIVIAGAGSFYRDYLRDDTPFDPENGFRVISGVGEAPFVLLANPDFAANSVPELVELAKKDPGAVNAASAGIGSTSHLAAEYFQTVTGTEMLHVPYEGSAPATVDLLAGRVDIFFDSITTATENIAAGKLKALAVTSGERVSLLADVPTMLEQGQDLVASPWWVFASAAGTPDEAANKLNAAANAALSNPDVVARLAELGSLPLILEPEALEAFVAAERQKWADIITAAGLSIK